MSSTSQIRTDFDFTQDWLSEHVDSWKLIFEHHVSNYDKFLEIGSFEGRSACWLLQNVLASNGHLYCIDRWTSSSEFWMFPPELVREAYGRFQSNTSLAKGIDQEVHELHFDSIYGLACLLSNDHRETFDFIYVDGSHRAANCLTDAAMAWPLLKQGGVMIFDDYCWDQGGEMLARPKMAIDAFTTMWARELRLIGLGSQVAVKKL